MTFYIVPNELSAQINLHIDAALAGRQISDDERQHVYATLLEHYNEHGVIPEFSLEPVA